MSEHDLVQRLLGSSGKDPGCDGAFAFLAEYVESALGDAQAEPLLPGVAEHLRNCPACREDFEGLLALASGTDSDPARGSSE